MRYLFTLACLLLVTATLADQAEFDFSSVAAKKALRDYKKAVTKDKADAAKLAQKRRDAFVESLERALKQSMQAGNLDEANKIDAAIKALKKGAGSAADPVITPKDKRKDENNKSRISPMVGIWRDMVPAKGNHETIFIMRPDKTAYRSTSEGNRNGRWQAANNSGRDFIVNWSNGIIENIKLNRDNRTFDAYSPSHGWRFQMKKDSYPH